MSPAETGDTHHFTNDTDGGSLPRNRNTHLRPEHRGRHQRP